MQVLIVKTSSLGDIVHTLPAVTDAALAIPGVRFDWVVEETFADLPVLHPAVDRVIPSAIRRWRQNWVASLRSGEVGEFRSMLAGRKYDLVIDAQGLIKSAIVARMAEGRKVGFDRQSVREPVAAMFYDQHIDVPRNQHAVERTRQLFARALGYSLPSTPGRYGITDASVDCHPPKKDCGREAQQDRAPVMLFHGTTWKSKQWPEPYWRQLCEKLVADGYPVLVPSGNPEEDLRAQVIVANLPGARAIGQPLLTDMISLLQRAAAVVAVDTGLGHLATALGIPVISIFSASDPVLTGPYGDKGSVLVSDHLACIPCKKRQCVFVRESEADTMYPPCFSELTPDRVCLSLQNRMNQIPAL